MRARPAPPPTSSPQWSEVSPAEGNAAALPVRWPIRRRRGKKARFGAVKNRDVFAGASRDGFTASPKRAFLLDSGVKSAARRAAFASPPLHRYHPAPFEYPQRPAMPLEVGPCAARLSPVFFLMIRRPP